jgi:diguanylate cyclase (GGDEF)-like protein
VPIGKGIIGHVYRNGTSYATVRPTADPHFSAAIDEVPSVRSRSVAAAPVRLESHVCGVLELVNRRGRKGFGPRDMQLLDLLAGYVSRAILNAVDILKQNELALHDDLTGLRNVRGLQGELLRIAEEALASDDDFTVIFVDVDRLKRINDGLGHRAGSEALRRTARGIARACGASALPFRFGGDEFVVLCPGCDLERGMRLAQRIQEAVRRATEIKGGGSGGGARVRTVELSLGVASRKSTVIDESRPARLGERLMSSADHALYRAKRAGRNRVVAATERDDTLSRTNGAARFSTGERP